MTKQEMIAEIRRLKGLIYHCPLARKKQRVDYRGSKKNGPVKVYSEEEIYLYQLQHAPRGVQWEV